MSPSDSALLRREVLRLAWPVVVQNLLRTSMFLVDTVMIGRVGPDAMAAMGIAGPITYLMISVLMAFSVGAIAVVSRAWGARDREGQERAAASAMTVALMAGVPLTVLGVFVLPSLADLFQVADAPGVARLARGYLVFEGAALFFLCADFAASGILRAAGDSKTPMIAALVSITVNIALNVVFIFGHFGAPQMGVAGAGLATAIAFAVQACLTCGYLGMRGSPIRLRPSSFRLVTRASLATFVRVSAPAALEALVVQCGFLVYTKVITLLGVTAMAAHRAALAVESLAFMPGNGFEVASSALVGRSLGEGRPDRATAASLQSAILSTCILSAVGVVFLFWPIPLVRFFLPGEEVAAVVIAAAACLAISSVEQPFMALAMSLRGALRGAGDTRSPVAVSIVGVWLIRIPLAWTLAFPAGLGLNGIWITMIADWAVRAAAFTLLWRRGRWKAIKL